jgi:predicted small lipoprotein YifL
MAFDCLTKPRFGLVLALAAGLALAGCGRKGPLEAPPSAALPGQPVVAVPAPPPDPSLNNVLPQAAAAPPPSPSLAAPPKQSSTWFDWLLN